jgi:hypothetical protein
MRVNPRHASPPRSPVPAARGSRRLATFRRDAGEELRVELAEFKGHPYISLRVWAPGTDGRFWPVKGKGVSVQLREAAGLIAALERIAASRERPPQVKRTAAPAQSQVDWLSLALPRIEGSQGFGEFSDG